MNINEYITRIKNDDKTLTEIDLYRQRLSDTDLKPLMNALEAKPLIAAQISKLNLDDNLLSSPPVLIGLVNLRKLSLRHNKLRSAPALDGLARLEELDLDHNELSSPPVLIGLVNLRKLSLYSNQLSTPPVLTGLENLETLYLDCNQLSSPPVLVGLPRLERLGLSYNQLSSPPVLIGLPRLERLFLNNNQLSYPPVLIGLGKLAWLHLSCNLLSTPPVLFGLVSLSDLRLDHNLLSTPPELIGLVNLWGLSLSYNKLRSAPALNGLVKLEWLKLDHNFLSAPPVLFGLPRLERLYLDNNQFSNLGIAAVVRLQQRFPYVRIHITVDRPAPNAVLNAITLNEHCNAEFKAIRLAVDKLTVRYYRTIATILSLHPDFNVGLAIHIASLIMPLPAKRAMDVLDSNFNNLQQIFADNATDALLFSNYIKDSPELASHNKQIQDRVTNIEMKLSNSVPIKNMVALNMLNQGNPKMKLSNSVPVMPTLTKEQFIIAALTGDMPKLIEGCRYYSATDDTISKPFKWLSRQLYISRIRANPLWIFSSLNKKLVKAVDTDFVRGNSAVKTYGGYKYIVNEFNSACGSVTDFDSRFYCYSALIAAVLGDNDQGLAYLLDRGAKPDVTISKIVVSIEGENEAPDPVNNYEGRYDSYNSNKQITDVSLLKLAEMLKCNKVITILRQRLQITCDAPHKKMCTLQ